MKSQLDPLNGRYIERAVMVHDYVQLYFEGGVIFNIYDLSMLSVDARMLSAFEGKLVRTVHESETNVCIVLDDGTRIEVDLNNLSFPGPERLQLCVPGKPTVIWD